VTHSKTGPSSGRFHYWLAGRRVTTYSPEFVAAGTVLLLIQEKRQQSGTIATTISPSYVKPFLLRTTPYGGKTMSSRC